MSEGGPGLSGTNRSAPMASTPLRWYLDADALKHLQQSEGRLPDLPASVFTSPEWYLSAAAHLLNGRRLAVLAAEPERRVYTLMAFTYGRERLGGIAPAHTLRILGYPMGDRHPLVAGDSSPVEQLLSAGLGSFPLAVDAIVFDEILQADVEMLGRLARGLGYFLRTRTSARSPIKSLQGLADSEALSRTCSKSLRTRLSRARTKLVKKGGGEIRITRPTPEDIDACLDIAIRIEGRSWKGQDGVGIFDPATRDFFVSLSRRLAARGAIQFIALYLHDEPIAYRYAFVEQGVVYDYNFAHLEEYSDLSPGRILLDETLRDGIQQRCVGVDASRGSLVRPHLLADWTDDAVMHQTVWLFPGCLKGSLLFMLSKYIRPFMRRLAGQADQPGQT